MLEYSFDERGFGYVADGPDCSSTFYVALAPFDIGLYCTLDTGKVVAVDGYLPLFEEDRRDIFLANCEEGDAFIGPIPKEEYICGAAYGTEDWFPEIWEYFQHRSLVYDEVKGIIFRGALPVPGDRRVRVDRNMTFVLDPAGVPKGLYITPDRFVGVPLKRP